MTELIDTTEMYLRTIFELVEEDVAPMRARIAERLGQSGPTVSQTVARMERDGLVVLGEDRHLEFTDAGRRKATRVMRKHRLAELLLLDVIGLDWAQVHREACRWEHVMSDDVERRLMDLLSAPTRSPYGNPIPGLHELGGEEAPITSFRAGVCPLPEATDAGVTTCVVRRLGENLQGDPRELEQLQQAGVQPGYTITVSRLGSDVEINGASGRVRVDKDRAAHIFFDAPA
jgi:DtxR family Mn-dependent transcriptional regulator